MSWLVFQNDVVRPQMVLTAYSNADICKSQTKVIKEEKEWNKEFVTSAFFSLSSESFHLKI